ncbi:MAG: ribosome biogenesis GTPase Der [Dehalococcoidales bacterium]|nr:ribosome biogenesis GTPase Der [Dehalococcoidales bacterium]
MSVAKSVVAIVGRRNVGKSTLLNRMAGKPMAIVADLPGTTRDRILADVSWRGKKFTVVDTGGLELKPESDIARGVNDQIEAALNEAEVILFVVDVKDGVTPADIEVADVVRRIGKPVILVVNKVDNTKAELGATEFYQLGLGEPVVISAYHGRGTADLLDQVSFRLPLVSVKTVPEMKVAIVGRPNVGKSTLLNALLGGERAIVDAAPGTTRDAIDTLFDFKGQSVLLIDTSGIRRRGQVGGRVERYSVNRAMQAIDRADVVLLVLDATELVTAQDMHIAGYIQQAVKGLVLVVNKWDLVGDVNMDECCRYIKNQFRFMVYAPVQCISAKLGQGIDGIMPQVTQIYQERLKRLPTAVVNSTVQQAVAAHGLPRQGARRLKILYATQAEVNPPTFVFFVNDPALVHFSYRRYLENSLRRAFGFDGTPIRFVFKARGSSHD